MTEQLPAVPRTGCSYQETVQRHRVAKRLILTALRDTAGRKSPELVLVEWLAEGELSLSREVVEALTTSLEDLALITREPTEYGDVLSLTHRGQEVARGKVRVPSIEPLQGLPSDAAAEPTAPLTFVELFAQLAPKKKPVLGWRKPLFVIGLAAIGVFAFAWYWNNLILAVGSYLLLVLCGLLVLLIDALLLLPTIARPVRATARMLDEELAVERQMLPHLANVSLSDLKELDARLATDVEVRTDREKLLAFGAAATALLLAVAGSWWGTEVGQQVTKDLAMFVNAGLLGMHLGAVAGLAAKGKTHRLRFVLGRAIAAQEVKSLR